MLSLSSCSCQSGHQTEFCMTYQRVAVPLQTFMWRMIRHHVRLLVMAVSVWVTTRHAGEAGKALTVASRTSTTSSLPCLLFSSALLWKDGQIFCTGYVPSNLLSHSLLSLYSPLSVSHCDLGLGIILKIQNFHPLRQSLNLLIA